MAVTAKDVAALAGVSAATVSMVFRGRAGISEATRNKVLQAAEILHFEYTALQKAPRRSLLQFVVFKRHGRIISDTPFFEEMIQGVLDRANELGYQLSLFYFYGSENLEEQIRSLKSIQCSGIILLATEMRPSDLAVFREIRVPIVLLDNWFSGSRYDSVVIDNITGTTIAVEYLIRHGHTRIGYLHSKVKIKNFHERCEGYLRAIKKVSPESFRGNRWIFELVPTAEGACQGMTEHLKSDPILPTAFFADNDQIAAGAINAFQNAGYRIPKEISVIGFDGIPIGAMIDPPLTTILVPSRKLGALAVERLDARIAKKTESETVRLCLLPTLLERSSVKQIQRNGNL